MGNLRNWKQEVEFRNSRWRRPGTSGLVSWRHFRPRLTTLLPVTYYDVTSVRGIKVGDKSRFAYESTQIQQGWGPRTCGACTRYGGGGVPFPRARPHSLTAPSHALIPVLRFVMFIICCVASPSILTRHTLQFINFRSPIRNAHHLLCCNPPLPFPHGAPFPCLNSRSPIRNVHYMLCWNTLHPPAIPTRRISHVKIPMHKSHL